MSAAAVGVVALLLASMPATAQPKPGAGAKAGAKAAPSDDAAASPSWVADELRILRAELEAIKQRPDSHLSSDLVALRAEVAKLTSSQAELERRLGGAPVSTATDGTQAGGGGMSTFTAAALLGLGIALGWVGNQLSHRWRDRRQRIRL